MIISTLGVDNNTYLFWQTLVAVLTVVSTLTTLWRMRRGPNKDEMTYFRDEVMGALKEIKGDVDRANDRLDNHLDHRR